MVSDRKVEDTQLQHKRDNTRSCTVFSRSGVFEIAESLLKAIFSDQPYSGLLSSPPFVRLPPGMMGHKITLNQSGIASTDVQPSYNGEEVTTQANVNIVNLGGQSISASAASEAFDEPLTMAQVLAIVDPFIA